MDKKADYRLKYELITTKTVIDGEPITTYGIKGNGVELADVSTDKDKVLAMLRDINDAQLEECHLLEYIEDCLIV